MLNIDCLHGILRMVDDGRDYKTLLLVCRLFRDFYAQNHMEYVRKFSNHLLTLLKMFPQKDWDWKIMSQNINLTWEYVREHLDYDWDWDELSANPMLTWDIIRDNPDLKWNWRRISKRHDIPAEVIQDCLNKSSCSPDPSEKQHSPLDWILRTSNPELAWEKVRPRVITPDNITTTIRHDLTWDMIRYVPEIWRYYEIFSVNPNITWEKVRSNPWYPWDFRLLSLHPNITWDIIRDNPEHPWNYGNATINPNVTWDIIRDNPDIPWNWTLLSNNPNITWDIIRDNPDIPWNWELLSWNYFSWNLYDYCLVYYKNSL